MTYTQAVEKACNGDSTGFEFLYDTTKNNKYYLALKYVKDEEAAKDVLQEAYIRAWKNLDKLKEPEKFDSWLAQIVVNTAKNELEKRNHTPLDLRMESGEEEDAEIMDQAVSVWENEPELEYTKEETRQLVHELIDAVTVGVISYNKSNDKNATVQENVPAVEEVPVNADQPIDGVGEDTETTDAPEDENGSEKYADIPESVLPSSVHNDKDYFEFWDEPVKATCWIDGVKGTIYADWDMTQIIKEVTYDVDGYEDELLIIGCTLDGGTHAIAIYNGQYVVVNDAMWDHWYNGKSSAFD